MIRFTMPSEMAGPIHPLTLVRGWIGLFSLNLDSKAGL